MTYKGIVKGNTIEIQEELALPEGSTVTVSVVPQVSRPRRGSREALLAAFAEAVKVDPRDVDELERLIREDRLPLAKPVEF